MHVQDSIQSAFADVPPPSTGNIAKCSRVHCPECEDISQSFEGKLAQNAEASIAEHFGALPLFTPEAFHYFIQAYMLYSVRHPDSDVAQFTRYSLAPTDYDDFLRKRFLLLTPAQKDAVIAFLEFLKTQDFEGDDEDRRHRDDVIDDGIKIWKSLG